jgi:hypothetical protein
MKTLLAGAAFVALLAFTTTTNAQKIRLVSGDISALKDETLLNFKFTYNNMSVGRYKDEADYIAKKTEDYNKKEEGRGDEWAKKWVGDREEFFEPKFIDLFEKFALTNRDKKAKYTLIFNTYMSEPGYNIMISRKNAEISGEASFVETANPTKVLAVVTVERAPGRTFGGYDYDTGTRLAEAYADAGKALAKFIKKK